MEDFNIHNWQKRFLNKKILNEQIHNPSSTGEFNKLVEILQQAVRQAEKVYQDGQTNPESYEGTEGVDLGLLLEQVWNSFSTGTPTDDMYRDEIFK